MSSVPVWFQRKFEFTFRVEQFPSLYVRLRGTPARMEEMLRGVSHETLVRRPGEKWSAQEQAGHLWDLEALWAARVEDFVNGGADLTAADLSNPKTHEANHNARRIEEIMTHFRAARSQLMAQLDQIQPEIFGRSLVHPRLQQPMRLVDHLYFAAEHDDHHLARIWELTR